MTEADATTTEPVRFEPIHDLPGPIELRALLDQVDTRPEDVREKDAIAFFKGLYERERGAAEHEGPWQTLVAYRLTRLHLNLKNRLSPEDPLEDDDTPFDEPLDAGRKEPGADLRAAERLIARPVLALLAEAPCPVEPPNDPVARARWTLVNQALLEHLRVPSTPPPGATEYRYARASCVRALIEAPDGKWPSREGLVLIEEAIITKTFDNLVKDGQVSALGYLLEHYAFSHKEAVGLLDMSARRFQKVFSFDIETARAVFLARMDDLRKRAASGGRMDVEMMTLKAMAVILGLGKVDPEDATFEFNQVAKKITQNGTLRPRRPPELSVEHRALPAPKTA